MIARKTHCEFIGLNIFLKGSTPEIFHSIAKRFFMAFTGVEM